MKPQYNCDENGHILSQPTNAPFQAHVILKALKYELVQNSEKYGSILLYMGHDCNGVALEELQNFNFSGRVCNSTAVHDT